MIIGCGRVASKHLKAIEKNKDRVELKALVDVSEEAAENSRMLEDIMVRNGFYGYWGEWWHYSDNDTYELIIP